ncbi:MAG: ATP-binding protein [Nitrospirota bacterium]|nr:ATP-binding protein [Nitrospirota bacterium]
MKRIIIISITVFSLIFIISIGYIITSIEKSTSTLDKLIVLHQVEILREHLLIQIKRVQADLNLKNTRYARSVDTVVSDVANLQNVADTCFDCHHDEEVTQKLKGISSQIEEYKNALSRVFTIRANVARLDREEDIAFGIGAELIKQVDEMIALTTSKLEKRTQATLEKITEAKAILYFFLAFGPLLTIVLSYYLISSFTKPIKKLMHATTRLREGDLDHRIEGLKDEFGEVARSFNEMSGALKEHFTKIQRVEQGIVLGELAAGLAHEIKNPLTGVKGAIELISQEASIAQEDREMLLKAIEDVMRIEALMKDLMNFAKPPKPQYTTADINSILRATVSFALKHPSFSPGNGKTITLVNHLDENLPKTKADPQQLRQIFLNLLLNAAEEMPGGGTLRLETSYDAPSRQIQIRISDTGKGIPENFMDKIFQPFFTTKAKGTGLGLAIIRRLIEQHEGEISVANNVSGGAAFTIRLPANGHAE